MSWLVAQCNPFLLNKKKRDHLAVSLRLLLVLALVVRLMRETSDDASSGGLSGASVRPSGVPAPRLCRPSIQISAWHVLMQLGADRDLFHLITFVLCPSQVTRVSQAPVYSEEDAPATANDIFGSQLQISLMQVSLVWSMHLNWSKSNSDFLIQAWSSTSGVVIVWSSVTNLVKIIWRKCRYKLAYLVQVEVKKSGVNILV